MSGSSKQRRCGTIICVGTTGMLKNCTYRLLIDGWHVHAIARNPQKLLNAPVHVPTDRLSLFSCDYHNLDEFSEALDQCPYCPDKVLFWIHGSGVRAVELLSRRYTNIDMCEVVGSATESIEKSSVDHRVVQLGFIIEGSRSRWLTHDEISAGVYEACVGSEPLSKVGVTEPWSMRP